jgi:glyoxylase-like metal-dependent hydrolase (beta-lactamase superfamily II)
MQMWTTEEGTMVARVLAGRSNAFLLSRGPVNILIDTGRRAQRHRLVERLRTLGATRLDALVLTHTHFDHAENAAFIKKTFGVNVIVHGAEERFLREGVSPLPKGTLPPARLLVRLAARLGLSFAYEPCQPDIRVEDRFDLSGFGLDAYLLHTPGHSRGSLSLVLESELAFVGDAMFGVFPRSVFPPYADDVGEMVSSWKVLLDTRCRLFLPGHGSPDSRKLLEKCLERRLR